MTLKELSVEVGASPSIISRVLNGYNQNFSISNELREKILQKAKEHNYRPNPIFRAIKQKENKQISVLFYSPSPKSVGLTMDEMVDEASLSFAQRGYMINFTFSSTPREQLVYQLPPWKVAGLLIPDCQAQKNVKAIEAAGMPYVCMNGVSGEKGTAVLCDEEDGMRQILTHLYRMGHRNICLCQYQTTQLDCYSIYHIRYEAFRRICAEMGIAAHYMARISPDQTGEFEKDQHDLNLSDIAALFDQKITALICEATICLEMYHHVHSLGKTIPQGLSIVAYNDEAELKWLLPPVTVFRIPGRTMGKLAADILYRKITGDPEYSNGKQHLLKGELIVRQSVAEIK